MYSASSWTMSLPSETVVMGLGLLATMLMSQAVAVMLASSMAEVMYRECLERSRSTLLEERPRPAAPKRSLCRHSRRPTPRLI